MFKKLWRFTKSFFNLLSFTSTNDLFLKPLGKSRQYFTGIDQNKSKKITGHTFLKILVLKYT